MQNVPGRGVKRPRSRVPERGTRVPVKAHPNLECGVCYSVFTEVRVWAP